MEAIDDVHCSFCGRDNRQVKKLIAGPKVYICTDCVETCYDMLVKSDLDSDDDTIPESLDDEDVRSSPREIKEFLDQYIVGQEDAKKVVSVAAYNHYKRIDNPVVEEVEIDKSNILLLGPTGSGKTLIAQSLGRFLDVPCVVCDATSLTEAGYVGEDVESIVARLLAASRNDVALAERGIIFIDEIDKKRAQKSSSSTRDVSGEGVQQALLRMLEGTDVKVQPKKGGETITVNTRNILFILSGAFVGLDKIVEGKKSTIGFGTEKVEHTGALKVKTQHLVKYGLIPELVGRLPVVASLESLDEEQLLHVLSEPRNAVTKQVKAMFALEGVELEFTHEALMAIAKQAIADKTGARGLRAVIEKSLLNMQYELPDLVAKGLTKVVFDVDAIEDHTKVQCSFEKMAAVGSS